MTSRYRLEPKQLTSRCNIDECTFTTTDELKPLEGIIGQERGSRALRFGIRGP